MEKDLFSKADLLWTRTVELAQKKEGKESAAHVLAETLADGLDNLLLQEGDALSVEAVCVVADETKKTVELRFFKKKKGESPVRKAQEGSSMDAGAVKKSKHIAGTEDIHAVAEQINEIADRLGKNIRSFKI